MFALPPVSARSATSRYRNRWKQPVVDYSGVANVCATTRECQVSYQSISQQMETAGSGLFKQPTTKEPRAVELPERDANRCILVRGSEPVSVLLCEAEELLHLLRSWRCGRAVRIEWPCELSEEAVEFMRNRHANMRAKKAFQGLIDRSRTMGSKRTAKAR